MQDAWSEFEDMGTVAPQPVGIATIPDANADRERAIEDERLRLQREAAARQAAKFEREQGVTEGGFDASEGERKSAAFLLRALGANQSFEKAGEGARSLPGQWFRDSFPDLENQFNSDERQIADSAQDEFIAASLRQDSGAAIPEEELERQRRIYFPMPGDGEAVIEQKRQARLRAIEGLKQSSGRLRESSIERFEAMTHPEEDRGTVWDRPSNGGGGDLDEDQSRYSTPEDRAVAAELQSIYDSGGSISDMVEVSKKYGRPPNLAGWQTAIKYREENGLGAKVDIPKSGVRTTFGQGLANVGTTGVGSFLTGVADFHGGLDEAAAFVSSQVTGEDYTEELERLNATKQAIEEINPGANLAGELVGGLVTGGLGAKLAPKLATGLTATRKATAATSAVTGGVIGALENNDDRLMGAVTGAAAGGAGGAIGKTISDKIAARSGNVNGAEVIEAADSLNADLGTNIAPIPADVGGSTTRILTAAMEKTPIASGPLNKSAGNVLSEAERARNLIAQRQGQVSNDIEVVGGKAAASIGDALKKRKKKVDGLYARARKEAGDTQVDLSEARRVLDENIAELEGTPGGAKGLAYLQDLRSELDQPYGVEGVRRMRTSIRDDLVGEGQHMTDIERRALQVVDAAEVDVVTALQKDGKGKAADLYADAAAEYRARREFIDNTVTPIIGRRNNPKSAEQVFRALETASKTDKRRFREFMDNLGPDEANSVRAEFAARLGNANPGAQNAEGSAFSLNTFLTNYAKMKDTKSDALVFDGETRAALDKLAKVAEGSKAAGRYASPSGSSVATLGVGGGVTYGAMTSLPATILGASSVYLTGKLMASPTFARWLAGSAKKKTIKEQRAHIGALSKIAGANTFISREALDLQKALNDNFGFGPVSAAADEEKTKTQGEAQ